MSFIRVGGYHYYGQSPLRVSVVSTVLTPSKRQVELGFGDVVDSCHSGRFTASQLRLLAEDLIELADVMDNGKWA